MSLEPLTGVSASALGMQGGIYEKEFSSPVQSLRCGNRDFYFLRKSIRSYFLELADEDGWKREREMSDKVIGNCCKEV